MSIPVDDDLRIVTSLVVAGDGSGVVIKFAMQDRPLAESVSLTPRAAEALGAALEQGVTHGLIPPISDAERAEIVALSPKVDDSDLRNRKNPVSGMMIAASREGFKFDFTIGEDEKLAYLVPPKALCLLDESLDAVAVEAGTAQA